MANQQIIFQTPRLILRRITEADAPLLLEMNSDPEILKYIHEAPLTSVEHALQIMRDIIFPQYENNLGRWAMIIKDSNEFIGWCGLKHRPEISEIDLGYRMMKRYWGNGYATEAASHTLSYGLNELKLPIITARAHIENIASQKVIEKIGMEFIGEGIVDDCPVRTYVKKATST